MRIDPDGSLVHIGSAMFDTVITAVLLVLCSLPIITIGVAVTATHFTMCAIAQGNCAGVLKTYFRSFRQNWKISTKLWILFALLGLLLVGDFYVCFGLKATSGAMLTAMQSLSLGCAVVYVTIFSYVFAGVACYNVTIPQALRNAVYWSFMRPLHTLGLFLLNVGLAFGFYLGGVLVLPFLAVGLYLQALIINDAFGFHKNNHLDSVDNPEERTDESSV